MSSAAPRRWTGLIGSGLSLRLRSRRALLCNTEHWRRESARIQVNQLRVLLRTARDTEVGRKNGFAKLLALSDDRLIEAYQKTMPVSDWYAYQSEFARMREGGEPDVLWAGLVRDFAQTSGTTAGDKFIPVSKEMNRSNFRASLDIFANLERFGVRSRRLMDGKCLFLGGSTAVDVNTHGVRTGDLSGLATDMIRWPLTEIYTPGKGVALESHWPTKIEKMARMCMDQDVRFVSGMPSWALVLFQRMVEMAREDGRDVSCVRDIWPNLMVFVHGGVKYEPFRRRVAQAFSGDPHEDIPNRFELYPASEGFVAMQDTPGDAGLRLCTDIGLFFEFVPLGEIDSDSPPAFTCDQVDKGQRYVVVMSTCAGLWRYILGDVVEFDTIPGGLDGLGGEGAARVRIVGRHRHFINAFGENLIAEHIEQAVADAAEATGLVVGEFTSAPVYPTESTRSGLELAVEIEGAAGADAVESFGRAFDRSLKDQNVDYTTKRTDSLGMTEPTITVLPAGTFHRWLDSRGKLGGQHKCPRCANHREIIESVVSVGGA